MAAIGNISLYRRQAFRLAHSFRKTLSIELSFTLRSPNIR